MKVLKIYKNVIDDSGAGALADFLKQCWTIEELHMSHNSLTGSGVETIVAAAAKSRMRNMNPLWLRLEQNKVRNPEETMRQLTRNYSVCARTDRQRCTVRTCTKGCKVHLPHFHLQSDDKTRRYSGDASWVREASPPDRWRDGWWDGWREHSRGRKRASFHEKKSTTRVRLQEAVKDRSPNWFRDEGEAKQTLGWKSDGSDKTLGSDGGGEKRPVNSLRQANSEEGHNRPVCDKTEELDGTPRNVATATLARLGLERRAKVELKGHPLMTDVKEELSQRDSEACSDSDLDTDSSSLSPSVRAPTAVLPQCASPRASLATPQAETVAPVTWRPVPLRSPRASPRQAAPPRPSSPSPRARRSPSPRARRPSDLSTSRPGFRRPHHGRSPGRARQCRRLSGSPRWRRRVRSERRRCRESRFGMHQSRRRRRPPPRRGRSGGFGRRARSRTRSRRGRGRGDRRVRDRRPVRDSRNGRRHETRRFQPDHSREHYFFSDRRRPPRSQVVGADVVAKGTAGSAAFAPRKALERETVARRHSPRTYVLDSSAAIRRAADRDASPIFAATVSSAPATRPKAAPRRPIARLSSSEVRSARSRARTKDPDIKALPRSLSAPSISRAAQPKAAPTGAVAANSRVTENDCDSEYTSYTAESEYTYSDQEALESTALAAGASKP